MMNYSLNINGIQIDIDDLDDSNSINWIELELKRDVYRLNKIDFKENDIVIDIGAHVGLFSIYLSLLKPSLRIIAFEPEETNYKNLLRNIERNGVRNIQTVNAAVSDQEGVISLFRPLNNSGGASVYQPSLTEYVRSFASSVTLNAVFEGLSIDHCKLLKIDCEGGEYKIFNGFRYFNRIDRISGEIHTGQNIPQGKELSQAFIEMIYDKFSENKIAFTCACHG